MTIGDRIKKCRIEKGMTQTELAKILGYKSKSSIAHIENGRDIPRSMVVTLASILDTTPSYLMGWTESEPKPRNLSEKETVLTEDERRLLDLFRLLSPKEQGSLLGRAELLVEQHREAEKEDAG